MSESLKEVWMQRDAWATAARVGKSRQDKARSWAFVLTLAGGGVGTIVGLAGFSLPDGDGSGTVPTGSILIALGVASAACTALGAFLAKELLTVDRETGWARARTLAEALKRECWRCLMRVPPYDDADGAAKLLRDRASALVKEVGPTTSPDYMLATKPVRFPASRGIDDYIRDRILEQANWYESKSREHARQETRFRRLAFGLGCIGVALSAVGAVVSVLLPLVPVVTTAGGAVIAWIQANRIGANVSLYREAAAQLRLRAAEWIDGRAAREQLSAEDRAKAETTLVEQCEQIMADENGSWRAQWLSEQNAAGAAEAIERVKQMASGAKSASENL